MPEPRNLSELAEQEAGESLVEHCASFAAAHGIDHMLDLVAGVHRAYAGISHVPSIRAAYEMAGVFLDDQDQPASIQ